MSEVMQNEPRQNNQVEAMPTSSLASVGDTTTPAPDWSDIDDYILTTDADEVFGEVGNLETASLTPLAEEETGLINIRPSQPDDQTPILNVARCCHVGAVRDRNEDSCLVFTAEVGGHFALPLFGLYIVADGMGGHKNGHIASRVASRTAAHHIMQNIYLSLLQSDGNPGSTPIQEVLEDAVELGHKALYDPEQETDTGTTLTIALVLGRRLYAAHVGDTRIYLLHGDKLEKVTTDHSLVQRLQDVGHLTAEEAAYYQYRHVLLRAVGQGEDLAVDTYTRQLPKKGKLLLCSDGLAGFVTDHDIGAILQQEIPVTEIADQLFAAAMNAGGYDNITAIVIEFNF